MMHAANSGSDQAVTPVCSTDGAPATSDDPSPRSAPRLTYLGRTRPASTTRANTEAAFTARAASPARPPTVSSHAASASG